MKVLKRGVVYLHVLCVDWSLVYSLWKVHLVNIRINKLQIAIKKTSNSDNF